MRRLALLLLVLPAVAAAHQTSLSYSELGVRGAEVAGVLRFSLADLRTQIVLQPPALPAPALSRLLLESFVLTESGPPRALQPRATPPRLVEPLIAASIVFIGVENLLALRRGNSETALRHRWMVTLFFGLIHGFGFASVLRQLQLPRAVLATGLVSFNLGVECGQ